MALLSTQYILPAGITPSYSAVSASDTCVAGSSVFLHVKNAGGSADTVTIVGVGNEPYGVAKPNLTVTVPATTGDKIIGPLKSEWFAGSTGVVTINHSSTTSVTCAVISF